ncbi:uncharacterized protein PSFLO_07160 [Pseudozyma flocculosa]|uniref:Uncharacterized protein n=1 Tax=Pseudozyma flocculosa TaxID=84751 RepID=A0A5C3FBB7_9BASI|nr:uncharacterized protein PSFLO_07160 [Pseudozyma flocculosa]
MIDSRSASALQRAVILAGWLAGSGWWARWLADWRASRLESRLGLAGLGAQAGWLTRLTKLACAQKKSGGQAALPGRVPLSLPTTTIDLARHRPLPANNPRLPLDLCLPSDLRLPPPPNCRQPSLAAIGPINLDATNKHLPQPPHPATIDANLLPPPTRTCCYCQRQLAPPTQQRPPLASVSHKLYARGRYLLISDHRHVSSSRHHQIADANPGLTLASFVCSGIVVLVDTNLATKASMGFS